MLSIIIAYSFENIINPLLVPPSQFLVKLIIIEQFRVYSMESIDKPGEILVLWLSFIFNAFALTSWCFNCSLMESTRKNFSFC